MNALAIPQSSNITPLHPHMCTHCQQKPTYAPKAIYCGKSCTDKAYRARKREKTATIARERSQTHRVEQLIAIVERQSEQIAALTAIIQQQPAVTPQYISNVQPQQIAEGSDLLQIKKTNDTTSSRNLLNQLLEVSKPSLPTHQEITNTTTKKIATTKLLLSLNSETLVTTLNP